MSRVRIDARMTPRAKAGSSSALSDPQKSTPQPGNPPAANQPSCTENSRISRIPNQNSGVASPSWVKNMTVTSPVPVLMPGGVNPEGKRDGDGKQHGQQRHRAGDREAASDQLGDGHLVVDRLVALSGRADGRSSARYWPMKGLSRPRSARRVARDSGVALIPRMIWAGSPGRTKRTENTVMETRNRSRSSVISFLARYGVI